MSTGDVPSEEQGGEQAVRYVLFVCNHNAGRSQMAQAFFERYGPDDILAESAGTDPAREIWPPVVEAHIRELIAVRLDAIRSDRTAHQLRLARLLPMLADEFADIKPADEIRACADAVLATFGGARVRSHIMTSRTTRPASALHRDTCDLIMTREGS